MISTGLHILKHTLFTGISYPPITQCFQHLKTTPSKTVRYELVNCEQNRIIEQYVNNYLIQLWIKMFSTYPQC